jgi:hypothetical protein
MSSFGFGGFARPKLEVVAAFAKSVSNERKPDLAPVSVKRAQELSKPCESSISELDQKGHVPFDDNTSPNKTAEPTIIGSQSQHGEKANEGPDSTPSDMRTSAISMSAFMKMAMARRCVTLCSTLNHMSKKKMPFIVCIRIHDCMPWSHELVHSVHLFLNISMPSPIIIIAETIHKLEI